MFLLLSSLLPFASARQNQAQKPVFSYRSEQGSRGEL